MPNILNENGLETKTRSELLAELTLDFKRIYGADINLDSDTPDGQMLNVFTQGYLDLLDLVRQVYASFDPESAIGRVLDSRVAINGIKRQAGSKTVTNISIETNSAVTIFGKDQETEEVFTVSDNSGNEFELTESQTIASTIASPATNIFSFQAKEIGEILTLPNTITNVVSIVFGIVSVNNPTTYTTLGSDEETDTSLKLRRLKSISLVSQGFLSGLSSALNNVAGVLEARVFENNTSLENLDGTPPHSIWVILEGAPDSAKIADVIYKKRSFGVGMRGETSKDISQVDGTLFTVKWDSVITENIFVIMNITSVDESKQPLIKNIESELATNLNLRTSSFIDSNIIATEVKKIDSNSFVNSAVFTNGRKQEFTLSGVPTSGSLKLGFEDSFSTVRYSAVDATVTTQIQNAIRLLTDSNNSRPFKDAVVTGSYSSQVIKIDLKTTEPVLSLLTIYENNLEDANNTKVEIVASFSQDNVVVKPISKKHKLIFKEEGIITNLIITPKTFNIPSGQTQQFTAFGGYGDLVFTIMDPESGSINDITQAGLFNGQSQGVVKIKVSDSIGNSTIVTGEVV